MGHNRTFEQCIFCILALRERNGARALDPCCVGGIDRKCKTSSWRWPTGSSAKAGSYGNRSTRIATRLVWCSRALAQRCGSRAWKMSDLPVYVVSWEVGPAFLKIDDDLARPPLMASLGCGLALSKDCSAPAQCSGRSGWRCSANCGSRLSTVASAGLPASDNRSLHCCICTRQFCELYMACPNNDGGETA